MQTTTLKSPRLGLSLMNISYLTEHVSIAQPVLLKNVDTTVRDPLMIVQLVIIMWALFRDAALPRLAAEFCLMTNASLCRIMVVPIYYVERPEVLGKTQKPFHSTSFGDGYNGPLTTT